MRIIPGTPLWLVLLAGMGFQSSDLDRTAPLPLLPGTVQGKVTAADAERGLVILSVGIREGIQKGQEFTLYRRDRFIAKGVTEKLTRTWTGGKITVKRKAPAEQDLALVGPGPLFVPPEGLEGVLTLPVQGELVAADLVLLGTVQELGPEPAEWSGDEMVYQTVVYRTGEVLRGRLSAEEIAVRQRVVKGAQDVRDDRPGLSPACYKKDGQFIVYGKFKPSGKEGSRHEYTFVASTVTADEETPAAVIDLLNAHQP